MTKQTNTKSTSTRLIAYSLFGGQAVVEFTEQGWELIEDTREVKVGYLHIEDGVSAPAITDAVRNNMIAYFFSHPEGTPGIGATPQKQYWTGLNTRDLEQIGNQSKQGYYNL